MRDYIGGKVPLGVTFNDEKQVNPRVECIPECGDIYKV